jgi:hypothetical protein
LERRIGRMGGQAEEGRRPFFHPRDSVGTHGIWFPRSIQYDYCNTRRIPPRAICRLKFLSCPWPILCLRRKWRLPCLGDFWVTGGKSGATWRDIVVIVPSHAKYRVIFLRKMRPMAYRKQASSLVHLSRLFVLAQDQIFDSNANRSLGM